MGEMADFERDYGNGREGTGGVHKKLYTMPTLKRAAFGPSRLNAGLGPAHLGETNGKAKRFYLS